MLKSEYEKRMKLNSLKAKVISIKSLDKIDMAIGLLGNCDHTFPEDEIFQEGLSAIRRAGASSQCEICWKTFGFVR